MRLWSINFNYLDSKGLVALWREALLAKNVLIGKTKGYKNHPQLERFKDTSFPEKYINNYLLEIYNESQNRNFNFNKSKIGETYILKPICVTENQVKYEFKHLQNKLKIRDNKKYISNLKITMPKTVNIFTIVKGPIAKWERT